MKDAPQVIDLYSGVGGLSLGAARAGFNLACAVENDQHAVAYHALNFPNSVHLDQDVSTLTGKDLLQKAGLSKGQLDGLIGGPPCQGFSVMGPRDSLDGRNDLFGHFFRLVAETQPRFFVAENVPGILDKRYDNIRAEAFSYVDKKYVLLKPIIVKASLYGAPTSRTRIFFIGYDPKKYSHPLGEADFNPTPTVETTIVRKALTGLPDFIDSAWQTEASGWQKTIIPPNPTHFHSSAVDRIPTGVGNQLAIKRLVDYNEVSGFLGTLHTPTLIARYAQLKPGQADAISKAIRLDPEGFCPTLRAGTGSDKGSYQAVRPIHYIHPRVISPREGARLQGFPDWFVFHPTKWHSFRQIGNSVSPIVAEAILVVLRTHL